MSTSQPSAIRRRRTRTWVVFSVIVVIGLLMAAAPPVIERIAGRSIGALVNESQGNSTFSRYDSAAELPEDVAPSWLPRDARDIRVVGSGPNSGVRGVRIDAVVTSASIPSACVPSTSRTIPWDGGGSWPDLSSATTYTCDPSWTLATTGDRWYLWS
ncbi:hypothetical protein [Promicromonospora iranensis]|jgi:hypothetical protein|uniref:hypothetical protein n=1 Tax=Promicromonospora iranensis TaxID=1105144 RepID=UPI0023A9AA2D|nr:hypothetical protein [Promicromonospora iranensis]